MTLKLADKIALVTGATSTGDSIIMPSDMSVDGALSPGGV